MTGTLDWEKYTKMNRRQGIPDADSFIREFS